MRRLDLTNRQFGRLTAKVPVGQRAWLCVCSCGNQKTVSVQSLRSGKTRSCGCLHREAISAVGRKNRIHGGYSNLLSWQESAKFQALVNIRERAQRRGYESDLELSDLPILTELCPVFHVPYSKGTLKNKDYSPSIDRKNPNLPYLKKYRDNLVFISHRANRIKSDATVEELRAILQYLHGAEKNSLQSSLMDLNPETGNKGQAFGQPERLNEKTPQGDAIVRSCENNNRKREAETTSPVIN